MRSIRAEALHKKSENPTHGSGWIVQVRPTKVDAMKNPNPTNGSWWLVQVQPTDSQKFKKFWTLSGAPQKLRSLVLCVTNRAGLEQSTNSRWVGFPKC